MQTQNSPDKEAGNNLVMFPLLLVAFAGLTVAYVVPSGTLPAFVYYVAVMVCCMMALISSNEAFWQRLGWSLAATASVGVLVYRLRLDEAFLRESRGFVYNIFLCVAAVVVFNLLISLTGFFHAEGEWQRYPAQPHTWRYYLYTVTQFAFLALVAVYFF